MAHIVDADEQAWDDFSAHVEDDFSVMPLSQMDSTHLFETNQSSLWHVQTEAHLSLSEVVSFSRSLLSFLCIKECVICVNKALQSSDERVTAQLEQHKAALYEIIAYAYSYMERFDDALESFSLSFEHAQLKHDPEAVTWAKVHLSWGNLFKYNLSEAELFARDALNSAMSTNNIKLITACHFALFYIRDRSTQPIDYAQFDTMIEHLKLMDYQNHLAYCYRNYYLALRSEPCSDMPTVLSYCNAAIRIARNLKNLSSVAGTYQIKGIVYSYQCAYKQSLRCFKVCESLRLKQGNSLDVVRIRNGMGYFYSLNEDYDNALKYYHLAFLKLRDITDDGEACGTLYNIAWLYFYTRNYESALWILDQLHKLMKILNIYLFAISLISMC